MAKQKLAEVDEDVIRGMVTGDIPRLGVAREKPDEPEPSANDTAKPKRRKEPSEYNSTFLERRATVRRRQTYISLAHFAKIAEILAVVASDMSVPAFLDNLIAHHLEQHRDEINGLYADKFKKPL